MKKGNRREKRRSGFTRRTKHTSKEKTYRVSDSGKKRENRFKSGFRGEKGAFHRLGDLNGEGGDMKGRRKGDEQVVGCPQKEGVRSKTTEGKKKKAHEKHQDKEATQKKTRR